MLVQKGKFEVPYYICKIEDHAQLKPKLLDVLDKAEGRSSVQQYETISKSDWHTNQNGNYFRQNFIESESDNYYKILYPYIKDIIYNVIPDKNKDSFYVSQAWFHQYKKLNYYFYHDHPGVRWAIVYYLELPPDGPKTEFETIDEKPFSPDIEEGDMLVFPGWIKHRSPANKSKDRKTIIAFNLVEKEPSK